MKAKIVIASTLKPVIDPRAFEKIGKSLAATNKYLIDIIGSSPSNDKVYANISLHPLTPNVKGRFRRILLPWKILSKIQIINPQVLIIGTHELLLIGIIHKIFNKTKLVYDVRENYYYNLIYQKNYHWLGRHMLAYYVRLKEILGSIFIDHFLLAESCYVEELSFFKNKYTIVENKFKQPTNWLPNSKQTKRELLLSGTISEEYGSLDAVGFFKDLPPDEFKLVIIGHCPNKRTFSQVKKMVQGIDDIDFQVSLTPVPQEKILAKIGPKTIGLLPYRDNKSTRNKMPTKLYEYLGLGIPILISPNKHWIDFVNSHGIGMSIDFKLPASIHDIGLIKTLITKSYLPDLKDINWENEESKFLSIMKQLITSES